MRLTNNGEKGLKLEQNVDENKLGKIYPLYFLVFVKSVSSF